VRDELPVETADVYIRNWRPSRWRVRSVAALLLLFWIAMFGVVALVPATRGLLYAFAVLLPSLLTTVFVFAWAATHSPIDRMRLTDGIEAWPRGHYTPKRISHIELGPDPAEDYVEKPVPVPLCALTVVLHSAAPLRMIVSRGDALRLKEWAARHNVEVRDPLQSARLPEEPRTSF